MKEKQKKRTVERESIKEFGRYVVRLKGSVCIMEGEGVGWESGGEGVG